MFNRKSRIIAITLVLAGSATAFAQGSVQNFSDGATNSAKGVGQSTVGSVQATSAVVALPLKVVGAVGQGSERAGDAMLKFAEDDGGKPLPVTEEHVTAGPPPYQAIRQARREE